MKHGFLPKTAVSKWAVGLTLLALLLNLVFFAFMFLGYVTFNEGHWWDITVGVSFPVEFAALVLSIIAIRKDRSVSVWLALVLGILFLVFLLTHSLYIRD